MKNKINVLFLLIALVQINTSKLLAEGISVDAGLTPAQDRIIIRMQYRNLSNKVGDNKIVMNLFPIVFAYGLTSDITILMRNIYRDVGINETMMPKGDQWIDPFFMGKVKLYRRNTKNFTWGLAGLFGSSLPIFKSSLQNTYNPIVGLNISFRRKLWSFDLNNIYEWMNYNSKNKQAEARQFQINLAISHNIILRKLNDLVIAPVQEFSFVKNNPLANQAHTFGFISSGCQIISPHFKFECLYQISVDSSNKSDLKNGNRLIMGIRLLL